MCIRDSCYSIGTASYAPKGSTLASGTSGDYLHGRKLYEVEAQITNMFEAVPDTIQSVGGHGHRTSLTETTCSPP